MKKRLFFIPIVIAGFLAFAWVVMLLWNWLVPELFHWSKITYLQAIGLFVLSRILFGGFHFRGSGYRKPPYANSKFKENFMKMSDEEKQIFKEKWRERCGK
jgi:Ca2+/H+ antiporter, TMEM165/GDT1 family